MFYARSRLFLVLLFLIIGIILQFTTGIGTAWYLYAGAFLLMLTHFLFNNVSAAFVQLRRGKIDEADKLISSVKRPDWLLKRHRAYYHFTKGMVALQYEHLEEGKVHLKSALDLGLRTTNDQALALLNLAHVCFLQNKKEEAHTHLQSAKQLDSNDLIIQQKITEMEKAMVYREN